MKSGSLWRRWAGLLLLGAAVLLVGFGLAAFHLARIAEWAIESSVPGVRARVAGLAFENPGRLVARGLELRARKDGGLLLSLKRGAVEFDLPALWRREVSRLEFVEPHLALSPLALEVLAPGRKPGQPAGAAGAKERGWRLGAWTCKFGTFEMRGFEGIEGGASGKFMLGEGAQGPEMALWDVRVAGERFGLTLDLVEVSGLAESADGRIGRVRLRGGSLELPQPVASVSGNADSAALPDFVLGEVLIEGLRVKLPASAALPSALYFSINSRLQSIALARLADSVAREKQFVEFEDLEILSPLDPLATVVSIRALACEWSLAGLAGREIESMTITSPTLHVGEDLFWYMDAKQAGNGTLDWMVRQVTIVDGQLVVGSSGRSGLGLPLRFRSSAQNVSLSSLASLRADISLEIPARAYEFPSYELEFRTRAGELRFAYPPETGAKNLVGTIFLPEIRWRQLQAKEGWLTVTFDRRGINGLFGAALYRGYLNGGFSFLFHPEAPWIGWVAGTRLNLFDITRSLVPDRLLVEGRLSFQLEADALGPALERVKGSLKTHGGGRVEIPKVDELLAAIPEEWPAVRQSGTQIALRTLRDYSFDRGEGSFEFAGGRGNLALELRGPTGSRNLEIVFHGNPSEASTPNSRQ